MEGGSTWGLGVIPRRGFEGAGSPRGCGGRGPVSENFRYFLLKIDHSERDLRVHDIGKSSQVECLCKTE